MSTRRIFHGKARNNPRLFSHKKESSEKWRVRIITKDKKGNEKKTTNTTYTIFYNQVTLCRKSSCNMVLAKLLFLVVYLAEGLYTRVACFVLAKLFHFMALFLAMA